MMKLYKELAEYYFTIESQHRSIDDDIAFIRTFLHGIPYPRLLDLGCGTGEHLNALTRFGVKCTGLDLSQDMIRIAKLRFPASIEFIRSSMSTFDYYNEFDFVISLFGSFNYLMEDSEIERTLWNTYRALKPDGIGIFEIWSTQPIEKIRQKDITPVSTSRYNDTTIQRERGFRMMGPGTKSLVEVNFNYQITNDAAAKNITDRHIMRTYTLEEFSLFLTDNGFKIKHVYGNFIKEPYHENSSRIIVVFQK